MERTQSGTLAMFAPKGNDGACEAECPEGAITLGDDHFEIDPATCKECGDCVNVCPVGAPQLDGNQP